MSRQQSVLRNTVGYMLINIDNQTTDGEEKSKPEVIKLGLDLHAQAGHGVSSIRRFNAQACTAVGSMEATG